MEQVKYLASFKTHRSACMAKVNNFPVIHNFSYSSGTISTGFNITSFIENGVNNIEIMMGPIDANDDSTLYRDSDCEMVITRDTSTSSEPVTTMRLTVNEDGKINSLLSSNLSGNANESKIDDVKLDKQQNLNVAARKITVSGMPEWQWIKARPVTQNDLPELTRAYYNIWEAMSKRDVATLRKMAKISSYEMGIAEGLSEETIFNSYNLPQNVLNRELSPVKFNLENFKLQTYANGRVFRLINGVYENSPLRLQNSQGKGKYAYNPYFSIIDGKIVIVR